MKGHENHGEEGIYQGGNGGASRTQKEGDLDIEVLEWCFFVCRKLV